MIEAKDLTKYYGSGENRYDNEDITTFSDNRLTEFRRKNIAFIFQQYYLLPHMNVAQNVKMGARAFKRKCADFFQTAEKTGRRKA